MSNRIYDTSNTPTHCPHCGAKMHTIRRDGIRYDEADCEYSTIGGICNETERYPASIFADYKRSLILAKAVRA